MTKPLPKDDAERSVSRYRKVEVRTWGDEKFRALSAIPPCAQGLWFFLMTGPHTSPIPGLFSAGRAAMAEVLGWETEAFDKAFQEVFAKGMAEADWKARVVWVPSAIKHNKPASPNVVKSWVVEFDLIPECALKRKAFEALKASIHATGEAFGKAFDEAFGKAFPKASGKTTGNQEQEQEQDKEQPPIPPKGGESASPIVIAKPKRVRSAPVEFTSDGMALFEEFYAAYPRKVGKKLAVAAFFRTNPTRELLDAMLTAITAQGLAAKMVNGEERYVPHPTSWLNQARWADETTAASALPKYEYIGSAFGRDPLGNGVSL